MKRLIVIESGSKQNAALVETDGNAVLIDCGVSLRSLCMSLNNVGLDISCIKAVLVTHSHSDHTKGLGTLAKKINVPFYSAVEVESCERLPDNLQIGDMQISSFECSHDVDCCGYKFKSDSGCFCIATDTGRITDALLSALEEADAVMLESNHDEDMLKFGPYPPSLKQRILSDKGHLSNKDCAKTLAYLASKKLKTAVLAHISEHNNTPVMARANTSSELKKYGFDDVKVYSAEPMLEIEL